MRPLSSRQRAKHWFTQYKRKSQEVEHLKKRIESLEENPRDEFHTMEELYDYRLALHALWSNSGHGLRVCKSLRHSDGALCFGGGWFIVVTELPTGQVSNHYKARYWDLFKVPEVHTPPTFDGHTPALALRRMQAYLRGHREVIH